MEPGPVAFVIALLLIGIHVNAQDTIVVDTKNGPVRGSIVAANGHKAARFLGIPYAEAPVGKLRFQVLIFCLPSSLLPHFMTACCHRMLHVFIG